MRASFAALALLTACIGAPTPTAPTLAGSLGLPHRGTLTHGAGLPLEGPGFRRFRKDDIRFGHPRLVGAITRAAAAVQAERPDSPPLVVADLSAPLGGKIVRHRSHRTGRDADLLLFVTTPDGRPVPSPGFLHFGPDGLAETEDGDFVALDVERTWLLVRALAADDEALVQWLFVARWVEALLIEHALARGEDDAVVRRAERLLRQPSDSATHDDHLHVRIACTAAEEAQGCISGGIRWDWLPALETALPSDESLIAAMLDEAP
ncbi:MAG: penicillin-insensitive murein endopeptidase [Myxococcales bacterium]|nr:penicillin-insensitive murein endopeptidase [Myxococcales bacterium]